MQKNSAAVKGSKGSAALTNGGPPTPSVKTTALVIEPIDSWYDASQDDDKKTDSKVVPQPSTTVSKTLKNLLKGTGKGKRGKLNNLRTQIWLAFDNASSSATVLNTIINVRPSASGEFTSFAALFDEFRVHGGAVHFSTWATGQTNLIVDVHGVLVYDPDDNTAYTSVTTALAASQKFGPFVITAVTDSSVAGSTARTAAPLPTSRTGCFVFKFKCSPGSHSTTGNSQQVVTGNWCSTNITNTQGDYGYIKPCIDAAGSTVTDMKGYLMMDVEFRSRT